MVEMLGKVGRSLDLGNYPHMWPLLVRITPPTPIPCMYLYYIDPIGSHYGASLTLSGIFGGLWAVCTTAAKPSFRPLQHLFVDQAVTRLKVGVWG